MRSPSSGANIRQLPSLVSDGIPLQFPRLHPSYFCFCNVHSKDALQLIGLLAPITLIFAALILIPASPSLSSSAHIILNLVLFLLDVLALCFLLWAYSRESHFLLIPFMAYEAAFSMVSLIAALLCFLALINGTALSPERILAELEWSYAMWRTVENGGPIGDRALCMATGLLFAMSALVSALIFHASLICFRYFRDRALHRHLLPLGHDEYAESPISAQWTANSKVAAQAQRAG